jgi:two-component system, OmpR family, phosphate regulon sensor histidine kinase PhoR
VNERELERKAEIAELLLDAARALGETLEPDRVYDRFHELLTDVVPHDGVVVSSYEEREGLIRCDYAWVEGNRLDPAIFPPVPLNREGGGMQSRVIVSGDPLLVNDVAERVQEPEGTYYDVDREGTIRKLPDTGPPGTQAAMMVPVKHEGRVVGVVQVMSDRVAYSPDQLELVSGLVAQMAAAVRNARLQKERLRLEAAEAAARAVAEEREQAAHVLEAVGDGIFLLDREGVIQLWNRAAEIATGLRSARVSGRPVADVFPGWELLSDRIPIAERGSAARSVTLPVDSGGRDLWLSFVAVRSADGVVYAFRDLTGERRLEEEKSDFIATISHELRTPMAAVYGAAQTLLHRRLSPDRRRALLEVIVSQASRLSQITERVLLASYLDRGEVAVQREPVDVAAVVRASVDAVRPQLGESTEVDVELADELGAASADPDRTQQVLINLLDNALKYGAAPLRVRAERADSAVRISVADSGPGITLAEQQRIFEKFYRVDPQLSRAPSGTGLGLYIARELVQRMGGRLEVSSEPGAGATFVVELPRA